ncbi:WD40 repeat protein [Jejuia pallidilutea]|uniref:WD40 repeat protein n=1 Tax=Jejuia pallidilutea TaxID=504487 RepID=A0A362WZK9_9FLAO|nr:PD40 domain-containing protein [Jejuia pallidilutea]PQV47378.1 WD40 repeat protein [Jejuia pallidilutea]
MRVTYTTLLLVFCFITAYSQENIKPVLPEIVTQFPNVRDIAISPKGDEVLFTAQNVLGTLSAIVEVKKQGNVWGPPQIASFSGQYFDLEPYFGKDGLTLYFASTRPNKNTSEHSKNFDIWYVTRQNVNGKWTEPINMGSPINTEHGEFYSSIADNGNFYFTRDNPSLKRKDDIYVSELKKGSYTEPKPLPDTINSEGYEYNAFIAPDESYLIFGAYNRNDGLGSGDLYISYKAKSGWSNAQNMGSSINSDKMDYCPFVKNNVLYFTSKRDHTNTEFDTPLSVTELLEEFNTYENGQSRLYKTNLETHLKE